MATVTLTKNVERQHRQQECDLKVLRGKLSNHIVSEQDVAGAKNTIILQFKTNSAMGDWDRLIGLEDTLIQAFSQNRHAVVDGHDFGNGTANIFIFPRGSWDSALTIIKAYLKRHNALDEALIIKRHNSGTYDVAWPEGFDGEFEKL